MPDFDSSRTTLSIPSGISAPAEDEEGADLAPLLRKALQVCQDPGRPKTFLPNLLQNSRIQPYHVDRWKFSGLGSSVNGSDAICMATGNGAATHDPNGTVLIEFEEVYVNGLANAKPTDWKVEQAGDRTHASVDLAFSSFGNDVLPDGVDSSLVIKTAFHIRQPCVSSSSGDSWTATGHGTLTFTIRASTGRAELMIRTSGEADSINLHADVSSLHFEISGLDDRPDSSKNGSDPKVDVDIHVDDLTGPDRRAWHSYLEAIVNSERLLQFFQKQINDVLAEKHSRDLFASIFIHQIDKIINS